MGASDHAAAVETHAAIVFFVGDRAYKLKKPVDLGFLDFRRRADREAVCHREVELNRRLAADVYLGVADVHGPDGEPCDHLVVMRRMPAGRRLSTLITSGEPAADRLRRLARTLAGFHATARRGPAIAAEGTRDALLGRWDATFAQLRPFHGSALDARAAAEVASRTHDFLAGREPLFAERVAHGHIVDGHGDLIADDIFCLPVRAEPCGRSSCGASRSPWSSSRKLRERLIPLEGGPAFGPSCWASKSSHGSRPWMVASVAALSSATAASAMPSWMICRPPAPKWPSKAATGRFSAR